MEDDNRKFLTEFINLYERHSCLWCVESWAYRNKQLRNAAHEELISKCLEYYRTANKKFVTTKIANLRSAFRREFRKVMASKRTGSGAETVYKPTLWYYNLLLFTASEETNGITSDSEQPEESQSDSDMAAPRPHKLPVRELTPQRKTISKRKENKVKLASTHVMQNEGDEYDIAGKRIGLQLKGMPEDQRLLAEKIISDVVYYGRTNKLYDGCFQYNPLQEDHDEHPSTSMIFSMSNTIKHESM